jgi:hypothetical protein
LNPAFGWVGPNAPVLANGNDLSSIMYTY